MNKIKKRTNPRYLAGKSLNSILVDGKYSNIEVNQTIKNNMMSAADQGLYTQLVYGVIQNKLFLTSLLKQNKSIKKLKPWLENVLLVALYQLIFLNKVPEYAVVKETVGIVKDRDGVKLGGFVNSVLREYLKQNLKSLRSAKNISALSLPELSVFFSVPQWIIEKLNKQYGKEKTISILTSANNAPKLTIRANTRINNADELINFLQERNIQAVKSKVSKDGVIIISGKQLVIDLLQTSYRFTVQDESAMLVGESISPDPNSIIFDMCAAPGGKTTHIAQKIVDDSLVIAGDIYEHKLDLIRENSHRLNLEDNIKPILADATSYVGEERYNQILVDAPCSGLGLLRRKPEIRFQRTPQEVNSLAKIQLSILDNAVNNLTKDGIITYSTCTVFDEENQQVVDKFLKKHPEFIQVKTPTINKLITRNKNGAVIITPDEYDSDGFFIATLKRTNND